MKRYRQQRRLIGPVYHLANLKQYERALEEDVLPRVIARLRALPRSDSDEQQCQPPLVDLQEWMHMTVVEALGAVSLSWSPGYLACGSDGASGKHAYLGWRRKTVFGIFPAAVLLESLSKSAGRAFAVLWRVTYHTPKQGFKPFFPVGTIFFSSCEQCVRLSYSTFAVPMHRFLSFLTPTGPPPSHTCSGDAAVISRPAVST